MINTYTCNVCGHRAVTVDVDEGTTPMAVPCGVFSGKECRGMAGSAWYRVPAGLTPEWEWYKPIAEEMADAAPAVRDHYERGGLELRRKAPIGEKGD